MKEQLNGKPLSLYPVYKKYEQRKSKPHLKCTAHIRIHARMQKQTHTRTNSEEIL